MSQHHLPDPNNRIPSLLKKRDGTFTVFLGIGIVLLISGLSFIFFLKNPIFQGISTPAVVFGFGFIRRYFSLGAFDNEDKIHSKIIYLEKDLESYTLIDPVLTILVILGFGMGIISATIYKEPFFSGLGLGIMICGSLGLLFVQITRHLDYFLIREWRKAIKKL